MLARLVPTSNPLLAQLTAFEALGTAVLRVSKVAISRPGPTDRLLREAPAIEAEEAQQAGAAGGRQHGTAEIRAIRSRSDRERFDGGKDRSRVKRGVRIRRRGETR